MLKQPVSTQWDLVYANVMMVMMVYRVESLANVMTEAMIAMNRQTAKILLAPWIALARADSMEQVKTLIKSMSAFPREGGGG